MASSWNSGIPGKSYIIGTMPNAPSDHLNSGDTILNYGIEAIVVRTGIFKKTGGKGDVVDKLYFLIHSVLSSLLPLMLICRAGIDQFAVIIL